MIPDNLEDNEKNKRIEEVNSILGDHAIESIFPTERAKKIFQQYIDGVITREVAIQNLLNGSKVNNDG